MKSAWNPNISGWMKRMQRSGFNRDLSASRMYRTSRASARYCKLSAIIVLYMTYNSLRQIAGNWPYSCHTVHTSCLERSCKGLAAWYSALLDFTFSWLRPCLQYWDYHSTKLRGAHAASCSVQSHPIKDLLWACCFSLNGFPLWAYRERLQC